MSFKFEEAFNNAFNDASTVRSRETSWDDALILLKNRHKDLELRKYDISEYFLRKSSKKLYRFVKRIKDRMERKGCWVSGFKTPIDLSVNADNFCYITGHLITDIQAASLFFIGGDYANPPEQCEGIFEKFRARLINLVEYFDSVNFVNPDCS